MRRNRRIKSKMKIHLFKRHKIIIRFLLALFLLLLITTVYIGSSFRSANNYQVSLRVPQIRKFEYSYPLEIFPFYNNILGAETFEAKDIVKYINREREKNGSPPLRVSPTLMQAAQKRADVIIKYQNFSHSDPYESITAQSVLDKLGYAYSYGSENIGMGGTSAEGFVEGFMNSQSHRENLLNPSLMETGVGLSSGPYKEYYVNVVAQIFAIPANKEESLGYSKEDMENYEKQLSSVENELNPLVVFVNKLIGNKNYTEEKLAKLRRKKEILINVYNKMKDQKPLMESDLSLITEYNQML